MPYARNLFEVAAMISSIIILDYTTFVACVFLNMALLITIRSPKSHRLTGKWFEAHQIAGFAIGKDFAISINRSDVHSETFDLDLTLIDRRDRTWCAK